jgi:rubrerythrin|tara:strand:+ start:165 stop:383 length:219 start_codon:yes stop_codon:yes gene_type:complete
MDNDERIKLRTLLNYWIKHNQEHSREFKEWAGKVKGWGEAEAGKKMLQATQEMNKVSEFLSQALSKLEKKEL